MQVFSKKLNIHNELKRINVDVRKVCEIGVYYPETCSSIEFIHLGKKVTLIEADPLCIEKLQDHFRQKQNVTIHSKAIWSERKKLTFYRANASTFAEDITESPAIVNDAYALNETDAFVADAVLFSDIDPGDFDVVLVDVEGAEWDVISFMKSRPQVISIEMRANLYTNPNGIKIKKWLEEQNYRLWFHSDTDSIYLKNDIKVNPVYLGLYRLHNWYVDLYQGLKKFKKSRKSQKR